MKRNTHIYLAMKAIEFTKQSVDNMVYKDGKYVSGKSKSKERIMATNRLHILRYYKHLTAEACWGPDDILCDNDPYHIFKLFTDDEFPGHGLTDKQRITKDNITYYKFAGGLPYRIDHLAQQIVDMCKLRDYNDQFELRQIMYNYLLLSHYVVDAHVPMHCDLRDDPPKSGKNKEPSRRHGTNKPAGQYMKEGAHSDLETLWDDAVTPVAIKEEIVPLSWDKERTENTVYSDHISFTINDCKKGRAIKVPVISGTELMDFMINICIESKKRCQSLFPIESPEQRNDSILPGITRNIFADCIGNLMAIWRYIWIRHQE